MTVRKIPSRNAADKAKEKVRPSRLELREGFRDIMTVKGQDPNYYYRWVFDEADDGARLFHMQQIGYNFAPAEGLTIGQKAVYKSDVVDYSIVRIRDGQGYSYLMRIPWELREEDVAIKEQINRDVESKLTETRDPDENDGQYGGGKVKTGYATF